MFQTSVNMTQAPAVPGDFASENPRHSLLPAPGGFQAGIGGVMIGTFVWADATNTILSNAGTGVPSAFVAKMGDEAILSTYLARGTYVIPQGKPVGHAFNSGDYWTANVGTVAVTVGMKAYASNTTGAIQYAATGATISGFTETRWFAMAPAAVGELVQMSSTPIG